MKNLKDFREQWERTNQKVQNGYTLAAVHHPLNASIGYDNNLNNLLHQSKLNRYNKMISNGF